MGIIKAIADSVSGAFADQWKEIITSDAFGERTLVAQGIIRENNAGRGANSKRSDGVISSGSLFFVPEGVAAVVVAGGAVEFVITDAGVYQYLEGEGSIFNGDGVASLVDQAKERIGFGGIPASDRRVLFVNLREIRAIKFGTKGPQPFHDRFYDADLEILAFGSYSLLVSDPGTVVRNLLPANAVAYSFDSPDAGAQIASEFLQSLVVSLNQLSGEYRVVEMPAHAAEISEAVKLNVESNRDWPSRFGLSLTSVAIENIEYSEESRELVRQFSSNKMGVNAYEGVSGRAADIATQQKIADGVQSHGLGDAAGMVLGMGIAQGMLPMADSRSRSEEVEAQLKVVATLKEMLDEGALSQEEYEAKKREVLGL